ncbi:hypothetical protein [Leptolyngbya sp. KIOST-1]|uniref:hypothetical protein n=1 Tax=Leptolyngbya sp. KIOST-1 TaxID=1229172 RepID=UPI0012E01051|nr:hypothetical protein [Leptolyngbya sp. KIOST-1]
MNQNQQSSLTIAGIVAMSTLVATLNGNAQWSQLTAIGNSGQGTGYGEVDDRNLANFPPPNLYQEVGGTASTVTFINGSPDALTIYLVRDTGERLELKMQACKECSTYSRDNSPPWGAVGTPITFQVPPGRYEATGRFFGTERTKGFRSDWQLSPGWEYRGAIYTLNEVHLY